MRKLMILLAVSCAALAFAVPAATAQTSPTEDAYGGIAGQIDSGGSGDVQGTSDSGTLPFTGSELGLFALLGVALIGTGFAIRRVSRPGASA